MLIWPLYEASGMHISIISNVNNLTNQNKAYREKCFFEQESNNGEKGSEGEFTVEISQEICQCVSELL